MKIKPDARGEGLSKILFQNFISEMEKTGGRHFVTFSPDGQERLMSKFQLLGYKKFIVDTDSEGIKYNKEYWYKDYYPDKSNHIRKSRSRDFA